MQAADSASSAQTDTELIAAPGAGKQIVVKQIYVSTDTAQTVTFSSGAVAGVKEVATVDRGTSTGGTYTLTVSGQTTAAIAFDAAASAVKSALELLSTVTTVTVTGTGTVGDPWVCTFDDPIQSLDVSGDGSSLTGGDQTLTVTETTDGIEIGVARWIQYCAANGGQVLSAGTGHLFTCLDNRSLCYTSSASGNVFVSVQADIKDTADLSL